MEGELQEFLNRMRIVEFVSTYVTIMCKDTYLVFGGVDFDEYKDGYYVGQFSIESALNRNSVGVKYRTLDGVQIEVCISGYWVKLSIFNLFEIVVAYILENTLSLSIVD